MNWLDSIEPLVVYKRYVWFDYLRIALGLFMLYKGISFTQNIPNLQEMSKTVNVMLSASLSTYVTSAHLIGGALLVLGLFTRWMSLMQIPILLGAVFIVNYPKGLFSTSDTNELAASIIALVGLVFFFVMGAGKKSIDEMRRRDKERLDKLAH